MSGLLNVIVFSLIGGLLSLIGGILLLASRNRAKLLANYATPFAAGALLSAAFIDLLGEAADEGDGQRALAYALIGILGFFVLERSIRWFHHHDHDDKDHHPGADPAISLIVIGDTLHNFIDGLAIGAGFLVSGPTGMVVALVVALHEIPQEIGDFGLMLHKGMTRSKVLLINAFSALATTLAAVAVYQFGGGLDGVEAPMLGLVAGFFIYIAVSDIIPSIHHTESRRLATWQTFLLIFGAILVWYLTTTLHHYLEV